MFLFGWELEIGGMIHDGVTKASIFCVNGEVHHSAKCGDLGNPNRLSL
jgi:hypothetical protein